MGSVVPSASLIRVMGPADAITITDNTGGTATNGIEADLPNLTNSVLANNSFSNVVNQVSDYAGC